MGPLRRLGGDAPHCQRMGEEGGAIIELDQIWSGGAADLPQASSRGPGGAAAGRGRTPAASPIIRAHSRNG